MNNIKRSIRDYFVLGAYIITHNQYRRYYLPAIIGAIFILGFWLGAGWYRESDMQQHKAECEALGGTFLQIPIEGGRGDILKCIKDTGGHRQTYHSAPRIFL